MIPRPICRRLLQAALRAIYLDEKNPYAHYALAMALHLFERRASDASAEGHRTQSRLRPWSFTIGLAQLSSGRASDAMGRFSAD